MQDSRRGLTTDELWEQLVFDEKGKIREKFPSYAERIWGIWRPPHVEIKTIRGEHCIVYSVPSGWERRLLISRPLTPWKELQDIGWNGKRETEGILEDFLAIGRAVGRDFWYLHEDRGRLFIRFQEKYDEGVKEQARTFVLKWGPLWICSSHHNFGGADFPFVTVSGRSFWGHHCFWSPGNVSWLWPRFGINAEKGSWPNTCTWQPQEPISLFLYYSREAQVVLNLASELVKRNPSPKRLLQAWELAGRWDYASDKPDVQRSIVAGIVNRFLGHPGGPHFEAEWTRAGNVGRLPSLRIYPGFGFLSVFWLKMAQAISGIVGIYSCDWCGTFYFPNRKPQRGRHHFCEHCREDRKGSKRLWAAKRRAKGRHEEEKRSVREVKVARRSSSKR